MPRVAHLLPSLAVGGRERIVVDLCERAAGCGVQPLIITYDRNDTPVAELAAGTVPVLALDRRRLDFAQQLAQTLRAQRVDLLHAQGHIAAALARPAQGGLPMLVTLHVALGAGWRWLLPIVRGLRAARQVVAVSDDLARRFRPLAGRPIATVPTGVDLGRFRVVVQRRGTAAGAPFTFGIAARLHPVKRHVDLLQALRLAQSQGLKARLLVAGEGSEAARIGRLASGLDVQLLGAVGDMPAFLSALDGFVLCSEHEGTPAALLEAMACGLPCIATRVGGVPALAGDAVLLVPPRNPQALAQALQTLARDAALRAQLSQAGVARAAGYDVADSVRRYADCYARLLAPAERPSMS